MRLQTTENNKTVYNYNTNIIGLDKGGYQVNSFLISQQKHMLWVLSSICFRREIIKIQILFGWKKVLIKSYEHYCTDIVTTAHNGISKGASYMYKRTLADIPALYNIHQYQ